MVWVSLWENRAMPKSVTFMEPSCKSITFWGFMSRWIIPFSWACSRAISIWVVKCRASSRRITPSWSMYCLRVMPSIYSMTIYCNLSPKLTSYTSTILGWDRTVMALASLRNLLRNSLLFENSSLSILMATQRSSTLS